MGVAGCGKTSIGRAVVETESMTYIDADDLHPQQNVDKMSSGIALNDSDREPWLARVGETLAQTPGPVLIGCSALKRQYRELILKSACEDVGYIHLSAPKNVIAKRISARENHFMPPNLLDSQFADLEALSVDELGWEIDIVQPFPDVVAETKAHIIAAI
jgi:carbohydrate kinase (thermoresistant glucokinase family)